MGRKLFSTVIGLGLVFVLATGAAAGPEAGRVAASAKLPWAAAGWSERQAAAHLLDRFAFGPRPGDVDRLVEQGLETWLEAQLAGTVDDAGFAERSRALDAWRMPASELTRTFPPYPVLRREAMRAGLVDRSMAPPDPGEPPGKGQQADRRRAVQELYEQQGYRSQRELIGQLVAHKLLQAAHSERQLEAVLVDFWFNHFNVSLTDNQARGYLLSFERDAIAPGVLGSFDDLLAEVAAHPAMLLYLDNAQSTANPGATTTLDRRLEATGMDRRPGGGMRSDGGMRPGGGGMRRGGSAPAGAMGRGASGAGDDGQGRMEIEDRPPKRAARGLNENYARELLELHTLGVDGGYTQEDVIAVARAFSGWSVVPPGGMGEPADRMRRRGGAAAARLGVLERDGFVFRPEAHDADPKRVLGQTLPGGRGIEDGRDVLALVARHPSTARHLARKIAARFVADEPPPALVDRLAQTFVETGGDLRQVMRALAWSPEFWSEQARGRKIKSPFELAVSAVRALGGEVAVPAMAMAPVAPEVRRPTASGPAGLAEWIARMGQPLYAYQAPTGYPDRAEAWVSTGSLLSRMNFGLHLATGRVPGVRIDLAALAAHREPESLEHALATYAALLLPERDTADTVRRLEPMVRETELAGRVARAAAEAPPAAPAGGGSMAAGDAGDESNDGDDGVVKDDSGMKDDSGVRIADTRVDVASPQGPLDPIQHVVGVILGSPEFQRR